MSNATISMQCPTCGGVFQDAEFCSFDGSMLMAAAPLVQRGSCRVGASSGQAEAGYAPARCNEGRATSGPLVSRIAALLRRPGAGDSSANDDHELADLGAGWLPDETGSALRLPDGRAVPVVGPDGALAFLKRYAIASCTSTEAYRRLQGVDAPQVSRLIRQARTGGVDWEVIARDTAVLPLESWMNENRTASAAVWFIGEAALLLAALEQAGLAAVWWEPASFVIAADRLRCIDFGRLMQQGSGDGGFLAVLPGAELRSEYAAPEVFKEKRWFANSALYSIGVIAAQIVSGDAPSHACTECGDLDFAAFGSERLRTALQGLMFPAAARRWTTTELQQWSRAAECRIPDWRCLRPGAAKRAFVLYGRSHYLPRDLAAPLLEDLDVSEARLDDVLRWLGQMPATSDLVHELSIERQRGRSSDWLLMRLAHRLDPFGPRVWRGISFDEAVVRTNLIEVGRRASAGDVQAQGLVERLLKAHLEGVYEAPREEVKR